MNRYILLFGLIFLCGCSSIPQDFEFEPRYEDIIDGAQSTDMIAEKS